MPGLNTNPVKACSGFLFVGCGGTIAGFRAFQQCRRHSQIVGLPGTLASGELRNALHIEVFTSQTGWL